MIQIRRMMMAVGLLAAVVGGSLGSVIVALPLPAVALTAEEMLADPAQEARAREISQQVRCLVCQNQSIDDSDAELAQDLRREIRQQIVDGTSNDDILDNLRATYGDYVLLNPPVSPGTSILWAAPFVILAAGVVLVIANRRRLQAPVADGEAQDGVTATPPAEAAAEPTPAVSPAVSPAASPAVMGRFAMVTLACGVLGLSLGLYLVLGRPDLSDQPLIERQAEIAATTAQQSARRAAQEAQLTAARDAVAMAPDNVSSWLALAVAASQAGDSDSEITALRQALTLTNDDPSVKAMLAEAMSRAADGQVTIPARQLVAEILIASPDEPRALYMAGLAAYQDEDFAKAVALWQRLQTLSVPEASWMALLAENIADAAAKGGIALSANNTPAAGMAISSTSGAEGPSAAAMADAAEMSAEDRLAMIEGMVAGLAERLQDDPQNTDGWQRLARAYDVLGRPQQAARALIGAADAVDSDADLQIAALEYIITNGLEAGFTSGADAGDGAAVERLLMRLDRITPDGLERLFFRGHFARATGDAGQAKYFWELLLDRLPKDTPFAAELQAEIADL